MSKRRILLTVMVPLVVIAIAVPAIFIGINNSNNAEYEINLWYTYEAGAQILARVREYENLHPDVKITFSEQPSSGWLDKFISVAQTGESPDIFLAKGSWLGELADLGYIKSLTKYIKPSDETKFHPNAINGLSYRNELWALPLWFDSILLFYNPTLFDAKDLSYPYANWTELDFTAYARQLTDLSSDIVYGAAWALISPYMWPAFQYGFGHGPLYQEGRIVVNDSASVSAMQFLFDLKYFYNCVGYDDSSSSATQAFIANKSAMLIYGGWYIPTLKEMGFNYGTQILPLVNATNERISPQVEVKGWGISKDTEYVDICVDIIEFLSNEDTQEILLEEEFKVPTLTNILLSPLVQDDPDLKIQFEQIQNSQLNPIDPLYGVYADQIRAALQFILLEFAEIQETLDDAQYAIDSHSEEG